MQDQKISCLQKVHPGSVYGSSILRISSSSFYAFEDELIEDISTEFRNNVSLKAIGVSDRKGELKGIVVKNKLMNLLGRPYAIALFKRKTILDIIQYTDCFYINRNILSVAEAIDLKLHDEEISYYLLKDNDGHFAGIFSTRDMIHYLSNISKQDIALATSLQERLVIEDQFFKGECTNIQGYSRPAKGLGGDFYYVENIEKEKWLICLCDVSGKGVAASLITTMLWGMMKIYDWSLGLTQFVTKLNDNIVQTFHLEKYLTGIFIIYNEKSGLMDICDMGHSLQFLIKNGKMLQIKTESKNLPIGIEPLIVPKVCRMKLKKGERFFLFTDGLIEQQDMKHREFSMKRVGAILFEKRESSIIDLKDILRSRFLNYRKGVSQADDVSFLFVERF